MMLRQYYKEQFQYDLKQLKLQRPTGAVKKNPSHFHIDENTVYFGGRDWKNLERDIAYTKTENLESFLLCLFINTTIDLTMYTYFKEQYPAFREKTNLLKFGWSGFGPHYENPKKILLVPYNKGIVRFNDSSLIDEFILLFQEECKNHLSGLTPDIRTSDFISCMLSDKQFQLSPDVEGTIFDEIYKKLQEVI